jgi:cation diffusion facilitator CzcD-associated flavoprotein CzcO
VSPTQVVLTGAGRQRIRADLAAAGITELALLDATPVLSVFDDRNHSWTLRMPQGEAVDARVVVSTEPLLQPWIPNILGRNDFDGILFHAAQFDAGLDPVGKHVAVIGTDSGCGHHLPQLTATAASVTVYPYAPRRIVAELPLPSTRIKRWFGRRTRAALGRQRPVPAVATAPISAITPAGIRTGDGVEHRADVIVYGTGFTTASPAAALIGAGGVPLSQVWQDGAEPFLGVAIHGFPNYFLVTGPDTEAQTRYVVECLRLMRHSTSTRIEVLRSSAQVFNERAQLRPAEPFAVASAFDLSSVAPADEGTYDGLATLTVDGTAIAVRVRLAGRLDPNDGRYHWQGTIFGSSDHPLPDNVFRQIRTATLTVGERSAPARIVEQTPWGTHSVAGVGAPPYATAQS